MNAAAPDTVGTFVHRVREEIQGVECQRDALEAQMAGVDRRLSELNGRMVDLEISIGEHKRIMQIPDANHSAQTPEQTAPIGTICDMSDRLMQNAHGAMQVSKIRDLLNQAGKQLAPNGSQKNQYATVYSALRRSSRFALIGRGLFRLI